MFGFITAKNALASVLLILALFAFITQVASAAPEDKTPFPAYGTGPIEVRLYADYFCAPCGELEPAVEPILKDLLKENLIRLTLVDVPFSSNTRLYATYFLYALNARNTAEHAFNVKNVLFQATTGPDRVIEEDAMKKLLKSKGIAYVPFAIKPALNRYNALMKEDKIDSTPTCVIVYKDGRKEKLEERKKIVEALKKIK